MGRAASPLIRELGIGPKQLVAVRLIGKFDECSMLEIADGTNSDKASVTRMITSLVDSGWLQRRPGKLDRRQTMISLSPKGRRNLLKIEQVYGRIADMFVASLSKEESQQLSVLFTKIEMDCNAQLNLIGQVASEI